MFAKRLAQHIGYSCFASHNARHILDFRPPFALYQSLPSFHQSLQRPLLNSPVNMSDSEGSDNYLLDDGSDSEGYVESVKSKKAVPAAKKTGAASSSKTTKVRCRANIPWSYRGS